MDGFKSAQGSLDRQLETSSRAQDGHGEHIDRDDWEDWSDGDPYMADGAEDLLVTFDDAESTSPSRPAKAPAPARKSSVLLPHSAYSIAKPARLKSRARQRAQNNQAGIKLVTDMTKFRRQQQQYLKHSAEAVQRRGHFADLAALQALEGDQSQTSVGSWHWLKKKPSGKIGGAGKSRMSQLRAEGAPGSLQHDLSPSDRPIMIGLAFPSDDVPVRTTSNPQSLLLETPAGWPGRNQKYLPGHKAVAEQAQLRSVWSPDTEDSDSPRPVSRLYSQPGTSGHTYPNAPPVPAVPLSFREKQRISEAQAEDDYDDNFTPVTLFEEDGSPILSRKSTTKSTRSRGRARSPATATVGTPSGWWDHIRSPFLEQTSANPFKPKPQEKDAKPETRMTNAETDDWWVEKDEKRGLLAGAAVTKPLSISITAANGSGQRTGEPSPTIASSSRVSPNPSEATLAPVQPDRRLENQPRSDTRESLSSEQPHSEKARILVQESETPTEQPPPYSPPDKQARVRYRAVFPPGHPLCAQFPPSPRPVSPGLAHTMTSQGAINMTEVPLTPPADQVTAQARSRDAPLPNRAPGTYVTGDQFLAALGDSPAARVERQRRRHEKEDVVAHKAGGLWRGRGCIPENGCYGRSGREGRKRRRAFLGICAGAIAVIVLVVVLVVLLLRRKVEPAPQQSIWLNLTNYPPVPTGVLTVVGADNSEAVTTCVAPSTMWSCSLPRDQQAANKPYGAEQPMFVIQIQFDNSTRQVWNVPDGPAPTFTPLAAAAADGSEKPTPTLSTASEPTVDVFGSRNSSHMVRQQAVSGRGTLTVRAAAGIRSLLGRDIAPPANPNFTPVPSAPSFQEMWFLGNTTDKIRSDRKAGEATPFFISFLPSLNASAGPNMRARRGLGDEISPFDAAVDGNASPALVPMLVKPELNADGTPAPARMVPRQVLQQPLRLYDRGLETEHYGFYTYFNKSIYLRSLDAPNKDTAQLGEVPADRDGGALVTEANFVAVWGWTRFHVQIWTRRENTTRLLSRDGRDTQGMSDGQIWEVRRPGTFPYPITIREDTHGGDRSGKGTVTYPLSNRGQFNLTGFGLTINNIGAGSEVINPRGDGFNPSFGGIDGGTGGCKCAWTNFVGTGGNIVAREEDET